MSPDVGTRAAEGAAKEVFLTPRCRPSVCSAQMARAAGRDILETLHNSRCICLPFILVYKKCSAVSYGGGASSIDLTPDRTDCGRHTLVFTLIMLASDATAVNDGSTWRLSLWFITR